MGLSDHFSRKINYLRLSITDRCNLRCTYCMPEEGVCKIDHQDVLSFEELFRVAKASIELGIEKIRITGGEPLVRKGVVPFVERLSTLVGLKELVLTTNGILLEEMAQDLKNAGIQRVNISLDSLNPGVFKKITRGGDLSRVLAGIRQADRIGLPVKLNMVVMRGVNDGEIEDFLGLTSRRPYSIRFIEYMSSGHEADWKQSVVSGQEIMERIKAKYLYQKLDKSKKRLSGPSQDYRLKGALGTFGIITPVFGHFCENCNRIRVSVDGTGRGCLFSDQKVDLKKSLKGLDDAGLYNDLLQVVSGKPAGLQRIWGDEAQEPLVMSAIGG